jgi:hypothetical protein
VFSFHQRHAPLLSGPDFSLPVLNLRSREGLAARSLRALQDVGERVAHWWTAHVRRPARSETTPLTAKLRDHMRFPRAHVALITLVAAGGALRLWFMSSYRPGFVGYPDAHAYIIAARSLHWNPYKPVGYPLLLRALRALDPRLSFTVAVQHVLGLGTGVLIYLSTVPFVRRPAIALLPALVVLFGGAQVFLEHSVLSDAPYTFLLAVVLYCGAQSLSGPAALWWLALAGVALAASVTLRTVGLFLVPVVAAWALTPADLTRPERLRRALAVFAPAVALLVAYLIPQRARTGSWALTRSTNFALYARMAPIADCSRFTPPPGTAGLCEELDPRERENVNWYIFDAQSPAVRLWGVPPYPLEAADPAAYHWPGDDPTGRFARAVLVHQPLDYLTTVGEGLANYVVPRAGRRSVFEYDHALLIRELHNEHYEQAAIPDITSYYETGAGYLRKRVDALERYGRCARMEGTPTAVLTTLMLVGLSLSRGRARSAVSLYVSTATSLAVLPVALLFYDVRYAVPMNVPLAAAAAIGIDRLLDSLSPAGA